LTLVRLVLVLSRVSVSRHVSSLCVVSGIAKCLFCLETLLFLAESRSPGPFTPCLVAYCKTVVVVVVVVVLWL